MAARADLIEKSSQVVIVAKESMKAVVDVGEAAVWKLHRPAAGFAAQVGVFFEDGYLEGALPQ